MKHMKLSLKIIIFVFLTMALASCTQLDPDDTTIMAGTYAAQTLTAMPADTQTPVPSATPTFEPTATDIFTPTPLPTVGPVGPADFPEGVNPLTGLMVSEPENLERRPVFVKVANYPASGRPHAGLSFADMVFEYYIGAGTNRFMGMYYSQNSDKIGPVRSGRLVDPQIVSLYEGILGMEGAYVTILDRILEVLGDRVISGRATCPAICDDGRQIVTSVFADSTAMTRLAEERGVTTERFPLEGMRFDPQTPAGGEPGEQATVLFSSLNRGEWRFDETTGLYLRWIEDTTGQDLEMIPLVDSITEEQLAFSNVIVIFARYEEFTPVMHDIDIWNNERGERALIFRDGQAYDVSWATPDNDQPMQFFYQDGEAFPLKPGPTWVAIFGVNSGVTEEDGQWTFDFRLP